ncbi:MAG TPA: EamA family transporter [Anaerolineales bacterium]|nr:EamA family transporter [Anaerolineales bacterium]
MQKPSNLAIWAGLITIYIVWGSTYLAIRFAIETIPPFLMAGSRFMIAGLILFTWRRLAGDPLPGRKEWLSAAVVGLLLLMIGNGGVTWAELTVNSGIVALLVGTVPLWVVLVEALRPGGKWPGWQGMLGVLLGVVGIVILVNPWNSSSGLHLSGVLVVIVAAAAWAVGSVYSHNAPLPKSPLMGTSLEMLVGGVALLLLGSITGEWSQVSWAAISGKSILGLAYLIVFGSLIGFASYSWLLRVAPTSLVSTYAYVNPLIAILLGNLLAEEPLTPQVAIAAVVIVSAVVLINSARAPKVKIEPAYALVERECD